MAYRSEYSGTEIDEAIGKVGSKLDQNGDASNATVDFIDAEERTELTPEGTLSVLIGKISKWLKGLKNVAFSGSYNDLSDKPTIPSEYTLPIASSSTLGGIKIGSNLTMRADGTVDAEAGGTVDYNTLNNRPRINGVTLSGNKTTADLGITVPTKTSDLTNDSRYVSVSASSPIVVDGKWYGSQAQYEAITELEDLEYNVASEE